MAVHAAIAKKKRHMIQEEKETSIEGKSFVTAGLSLVQQTYFNGMQTSGICPVKNE